MRAVILSLSIAAASCASSQSNAENPQMDLDYEESQSAPLFDLDEPVEIERSRTGSIDRIELDAILERGLGAFLRKVEVRPVLDSGRFSGWEVVRYDYSWVDLQPGDIVRSVNGSTVESPTEAQIVWADLASAGEIVVQVARQEEDFELRFDIQGSVSATQP